MFNNFFNKLRIRQKLILAFSVVTFIMVILGIIVFLSFNRIDNIRNDMSKSFDLNTHILQLKYLITKDQLLYMELMSTLDKDEFYISWKEHQRISNEIQKCNNIILKNVGNDWGVVYSGVKGQICEFINSIQKINEIKIQPIFEQSFFLKKDFIEKEQLFFSSLGQNIEDTKESINIDEFKNYRSKMNAVDQMIDSVGNELSEKLAAYNDSTALIANTANTSSENVSSLTMYLLFIVLLGAIIISIIQSIVSSKKITNPMLHMKNYVIQLGKGNLPEKINIKTKDEIGEMSDAIDILIENLKDTREFAIEVGKGNYENTINVFSNQGDLGTALKEMNNQLSKVAIDQKQRDWTNQGLAKFADILRHNNDNIELLADDILINLVHYLDANQAGFYYFVDDDPADIYLELKACYAFEQKKYCNKSIKLKEGLVGTCAIEKRIIYMTDIPEDYIKITSGLGDGNPRSIILIPLKLEDKLFGVIEMASFNKLDQFERLFLDKIAESIAVTLSAVKTNIKTQQLLDTTTQQTVRLSEQEEELRQNLEEMLATQEEMKKKETELTSQLGAINKTNAMIEYDLEGKILNVNSIFCELMKYNSAQLIGRNHEILCTQEFKNSEGYHLFWNKLKSDMYQEGEFTYIASDGNLIFLRATYYPVKNHEGIPFKVTELAINITTQKKLLIESQQKTEELKSQQEEIFQNIEELSAIKEELEKNEILQKQKIEDLEKENLQIAGELNNYKSKKG